MFRRLFSALFGSKKRTTATTGAAAALVASVAFIGPWEGMRTEAYLDAVNVWTICRGHTEGVKPGDTHTVEECEDLFEKEVEVYYGYLQECLPTLPELPVGVQVAFTSWTFNVGPGNACSSTLVRKANAGDLRGACNELPRWNRGGGRVIPGLTNRRGAELKVCLKALELEG